MSDTQEAIGLDRLCMTFGGKAPVEALKNISASIAAGQITGIMGPDAAGKTTLMRILAGILSPTAGKALIFGVPAEDVLAREPNLIGYMPQRFGLYEDLSVKGNLELYARLRGLSDETRQQRFDRLLNFTGLRPFQERLAGQLSGGMKQKLGIACALLGQPRLLLLDEPGVGVDPRSRQELWEMVQELGKNAMTVIWATSYMDEAAKCPSLLVLEAGGLLYRGSPRNMADKARGNVFMLPVKSGQSGSMRRKALAWWTGQQDVVDVMIQGEKLRLVLNGQADSLRAEICKRGGEAVEPDLEDAYMALAGGIDHRPSPYADIGHIGGEAFAGQRIVARGLTKKFGDFVAAHDISFTVGAGEIVGLLGPNGAGKSTTFRMLCGLSRPSAGECLVDGVDMLKSSSQARERIGYMAQKFSLYPDIRVRQNIIISADLYGMSRKTRRQRLPLLAQALDLDKSLDSVTESLPLGLKQRLALLCATLHEPPVLFLDEPTSGVDIRTRRDFWKHISALTQAGAAVLVTTHFMEEAEYCDRIALIYRGSLIRLGTPEELKRIVRDKPNPTLEQAFISIINEYDKQHPLT